MTFTHNALIFPVTVIPHRRIRVPGMAAMVKRDINKKGQEEAEFPSVCESCLGSNPYIRMLKEEAGAECKICSRPFTVFRWSITGQSKYQKNVICNTCCRIRNCCSLCMLDLQFGLPIQVRDAALKLVKQGPSSAINREYYAQNQTGKYEDGEVPAEYGKTEAAARELLKKLAKSEPYRRKQAATDGDKSNSVAKSTPAGGPIRTAAQARSATSSTMPPRDKTITSLLVMGIEDDLPEHALRQYFAEFGPIKSLVCSHRSRCAFVNYANRAAAETAAEACAGEILIRGCPLRIQWGKPRSLGGGYKTEQQNAELARMALAKSVNNDLGTGDQVGGQVQVSLPPGEGTVHYTSMREEED